MKLDKELFMAHDFLLPGFAVEVLQLVEILLGKVHTLPVHIGEIGHPANGRFLTRGAAVGTVDNPLKNAHIFAEAGPDEITLVIFAEPVDVEDSRSFGQLLAHIEPVAEVCTHVIAAERQHGHGITPNFANRTAGRRSGFGTHGGANVYAGRPVECLVDQGHGGGAASAKNECADRYAFGRFPGRVNGGAL